MYTIKIKGLASGKIIKSLSLLEPLENISLMDYLLAQGIPVASSCKGEGVCSKCMVNTNLLSCQITLKDFFKLKSQQEVSISYL